VEFDTPAWYPQVAIRHLGVTRHHRQSYDRAIHRKLGLRRAA
jgi:hypothetical protein